MVSECPVELLVEQNTFLPQRRLIAEAVGHGNGAVDKPAAAHELAAIPVGIEHERACADATGLLIDLFVGLPSYRNTHRAQPDPHRAAKLDLAGAGADRLALQEKKDETSIAAVGQPDVLFQPVNAGLDDEGEIVTFSSPCRCRLRLMREAGEGESAVCETDLLGVIAQNLVGSFHHQTLVLGHGLAARFFNAMLDYELMNLGHTGNLPDGLPDPQPWTLGAQAISKVVDSLAISVRA